MVQYPVAPSDEVKLCCAPRPAQREGWLRVIFAVFLKVTVCVFTFVHITGSKAAHSVSYMLELPLFSHIGSNPSKDLRGTVQLLYAL